MSEEKYKKFKKKKQIKRQFLNAFGTIGFYGALASLTTGPVFKIFICTKLVGSHLYKVHNLKIKTERTFVGGK